MVDEAQDCSDVQMAIVDESTSSGHKEIMLVGDPFQAIYQFREGRTEIRRRRPGIRNGNAPLHPILTAAAQKSCDLSMQQFARGTGPGDICAPPLLTSKVPSGPLMSTTRNKSGKRSLPNAMPTEYQPLKKMSLLSTGSHTSKMSRKRVQRDQIEKLFQTLNREHHAALAVATQQVFLESRPTP